MPASVLGHNQLFGTPQIVAPQAPLSMGFSRQECWTGLPFPSPGDLPHPEIHPHPLGLLHWPVDSLPMRPLGSPHDDYRSVDIFFRECFHIL